MVCNGLILRRKTDGICGFRLPIPYLKTLNIPPGTLKELRKVAMKFPNGLLTDEDLLDSGFISWRDETVSVILVVLVGELIVLFGHLQSQTFGQRIASRCWDTFLSTQLSFSRLTHHEWAVFCFWGELLCSAKSRILSLYCAGRIFVK